MVDFTKNVDAHFDKLKEDIAALGRFTGYEDFRENTGKGYVQGLEVLYVEQLGSLERALQAVADLQASHCRLQRGPEGSVESVTAHLDALREDLRSFWPTDEGSPCLFAKHIENAEASARAVARSARNENEELRQQLRAQEKEIGTLKEKSEELHHTLMTERQTELSRCSRYGDGYGCA